jgi:hypothetical protein
MTTQGVIRFVGPVRNGGSGSGGSGVTFADGTTTVTDATTADVSGNLRVTGTAPTAGLTDRLTADIATGSTPVDLTAPFASVYIITSGGTKGVEMINLPAYGSYSDANVGRQIKFLVADLTIDSDQPTLSYTGAYAQSIVLSQMNGPQYIFTVECDGQNWFPVGWSQYTSVPFMVGSWADSTGTILSTDSAGSHADSSGSVLGQTSHADSSGTVTTGASCYAGSGATNGSNEFCHADSGATLANGTRCHADSGATIGGYTYYCHADSGATVNGSAYYGSASGWVATADGYSARAIGQQSWTRGIGASWAYSGGQIATLGDNQALLLGLHGQTADATPTVLVSTTTAAPSANNQLVLADNETLWAEVIVQGKVAGASDFLVNRWEVCIQRGTGAASTAIPTTTPTTPVLVSHYATAGAISGAWSVALSADTTNGALAVTVTGASGTNINWTAIIRDLELVL